MTSSDDEAPLPRGGSLRSDGLGPFSINDASEMYAPDPSWRSMTAKMRADAQEFRRRWNEPVIRRFYPGLFIAWSHRLAHTLHVRGRRGPAILTMWACHALTGAEIRPGAVIGPGLMVVHPSGTVIGGGTVAGARLQLYGGCHFGSRLHQGIHGSPKLGDDVIVGAHAVLVGPVEVGDAAQIGAASLVLHDVPPGASVKGSPAS